MIEFLSPQGKSKLLNIFMTSKKLQTASERRDFLSICGLNKYCGEINLDVASEQFSISLLALLLQKYEKTSDNPFWGILYKKLALVQFLEYLKELDSNSLSNDDIRYIEQIIGKWREIYHNKLNEYYSHLYILITNNDFDDSQKEFLFQGMNKIKQDLGLDDDEVQLICQEVQRLVVESQAESQELQVVPETTDEFNLPSVSTVTITLICFFLFGACFLMTSNRQSSVNKSIVPEITSFPSQYSSPSEGITPQEELVEGWMFIGRIKRNSQGIDILDRSTITPPMIPADGSLVSVLTDDPGGMNIREDRPQSPDFDYTRHRVLGKAFNGEQVKVLNSEILYDKDDKYVWSKVQKCGNQCQ